MNDTERGSNGRGVRQKVGTSALVQVLLLLGGLVLSYYAITRNGRPTAIAAVVLQVTGSFVGGASRSAGSISLPQSLIGASFTAYALHHVYHVSFGVYALLAAAMAVSYYFGRFTVQGTVRAGELVDDDIHEVTDSCSGGERAQ